jgi:hypothetical protein
VGPDALERILCNGALEVDALTEGGTLLGVGATTRNIPPRMRRAVLARDGGCTAAGCTSRYRLQVHHIRARSRGGSHDPANLTTLCWYHHHVVVHGHGFRIDPSSPRAARRFLRPVTRRAPP